MSYFIQKKTPINTPINYQRAIYKQLLDKSRGQIPILAQVHQCQLSIYKTLSLYAKQGASQHLLYYPLLIITSKQRIKSWVLKNKIPASLTSDKKTI